MSGLHLIRGCLTMAGILCAGAAVARPFGAQAEEQAGGPAAALAIEWRVDRRFRLWSNGAPDTVEPAERLYEAIAATNDPAEIHDRLVAFLARFPALHRSAPWDSRAHSYSVSYLHPSNYAVRMRLRNSAALTGRQCIWTTSAGAMRNAGTAVDCDRDVQLVLPSAADRSGSIPASVQVALSESAGDLATVQVAVRDRLIVSLGDSFASGEGNPDVPANLGALSGGPGSGWISAWERRWLARGAMTGVRAPRWLDTACHRSFYNQHLVAAVKLAAGRPHDAVTFVSYACSGAQIFGGLLTAQLRPPGYYDDPSAPELPVAQVEALARDLCAPGEGGGSATPRRRTYQRAVATADGGVRREAASTDGFDCRTPGRKVDAMLLAIGGNDVGFAGLIMWGVLPRTMPNRASQFVLNRIRAGMTRDPEQASRDVAFALPANLRLLDGRLREVLPGVPVLQAGYPSPLNGSDGTRCGPPDENSSEGPNHSSLGRLWAPLGLWPVTRLLPDEGWRMSIDHREAETVESRVVGPLNAQIRNSASTLGWRVVDDFLGAFQTHGWCAGESAAEQGDLPGWDAARQEWTGWNPASWRPYERRSRFFRTLNDTALTQAQEATRPLPFPLNLAFRPRERALLISLAGSFHPTFQAHVVMGLSTARHLEALPPVSEPIR